MSTWNCKAAAAGALLLVLGACEDGQGKGLLEGLGAVGGKGADIALPRSQMANGAVTLVPPQGYCIDRRSLKQRFALLARCDTLGAPWSAGGAPLGFITVSVTPADTDAALPTAQDTQDAAKLSRIEAQSTSADTLTFRAEGVPPVKDAAVTHWRGKARVGQHLIGVALYGPEGGRAVSAEGREIVLDLIRRTREAS